MVKLFECSVWIPARTFACDFLEVPFDPPAIHTEAVADNVTDKHSENSGEDNEGEREHGLEGYVLV